MCGRTVAVIISELSIVTTSFCRCQVESQLSRSHYGFRIEGKLEYKRDKSFAQIINIL